MFKKLSSNFCAINPLLMDRGGVIMREDVVVDYKALLTAFYVVSIDEVLGKCVGKEALLFSVIELKYDTSNSLNAVQREICEYCGANDHIAIASLVVVAVISIDLPSIMRNRCKGNVGTVSRE